MEVNTTGVVLRSVEYKEADCILTVLTAEGGLRTVKARACRRRNSPLAAGAQLFVYSQMTLFEYRDYYTLKEATPLEQFWGVREDVVKLALASYFGEVVQTVGVEGEANGPLLSLFLNSLYALDKLSKPQELVRGAFDLRCMAIAGYAPLLDACAVCGLPQPQRPQMNLQEGVLHCGGCREEVGEGESVPLTPELLAAARHAVYGDPKRLFSFSLPGEQLAAFAGLGDRYVMAQLERPFRTLEFYLSLQNRGE